MKRSLVLLFSLLLAATCQETDNGMLLFSLPMVAGEYCQYSYSALDLFHESQYCDGGCCGTKYSDYSDVCCDVINVGLIAGSVVGGLAGLAILIGIIICCCVCGSRSGRSPGAIVQPMNTNAQTLVLNNTTIAHGPSTIPGPSYGHAGYPNGVAPPGYVPYGNVPQGYGDPAYPPPYASKY